ncbi:DUF4145 domain-containing protein [Paenarthrobacter ureafaciens]|nr:DUF4145 domain-containing protein [Paenarthrobacter ureafaciens]
MKVQEAYFRDCPWCGVKHAAMHPMWSRVGIRSANYAKRTWLVMACPRCAGVVSVEVEILVTNNHSDEQPVPNTWEVRELRAIPEGEHRQYQINHLPEDVEKFFVDALRVMEAGVPDAAAVQLRRTLEAAAAHKGASKRTLVQSVEQMIADGLVTRDFGDVLTHVRKLGNIGAHYSDETLSPQEVSRALSFTTQFLRNVFEVPGELNLLNSAAGDSDTSAH